MHGCASGVSSVGGERANQRRRDALFRSSINIVLVYPGLLLLTTSWAGILIPGIWLISASSLISTPYGDSSLI